MIAAIIGSKELVQSTKLNKLITEMNMFKQIVNTFEMTYEALPGDMTNAVAIWGATNNSDGNGDNIIDWVSGSGVHEGASALVHLSRAELLDDQGFTANNATTAYKLTMFNGLNSQLYNSLHNTGYRHIGYNYISKDTHIIQVGEGYYGNDAFFLPKESYYIDLKIDDGNPRGGIMTYRITSGATSVTCTDDTDDVGDAKYELSDLTAGCNIVYEIE